ncbi:MAG: hypothetical protein V1738_04105 [Patescibacteria group bacterium]
MSTGIAKETAQRYLDDVTPLWRSFWFHPHLFAKNLTEFGAALKEIEDSIYLYHSEGHKNDLARWVREVVGDGALADDLEKVRTRDEAAQVTAQRLVELKKITAD